MKLTTFSSWTAGARTFMRQLARSMQRGLIDTTTGFFNIGSEAENGGKVSHGSCATAELNRFDSAWEADAEAALDAC